MPAKDARDSAADRVDTWPAGETFMFHFAGKWMTAEQMRAARVDAIMPRQPKGERWRKRSA
jgi:hypothetical protein